MDKESEEKTNPRCPTMLHDEQEGTSSSSEFSYEGLSLTACRATETKETSTLPPDQRVTGALRGGSDKRPPRLSVHLVPDEATRKISKHEGRAYVDHV